MAFFCPRCGATDMFVCMARSPSGLAGCGEGRDFTPELQHGKTIPLTVLVPADLSASGKAKWKRAQIDQAVADIVWALQRSGIAMRGSCSGHGKRPGEILLADGRVLRVTFPKKAR